jgi:hypothetical protein
MNWADSKYLPNSGDTYFICEEVNPEPRLCNTHEGVETRREALPTYSCSKCHKTKPESEFYKKDRSGRLDRTCKVCRIIRQREKNLGVTQEDYLAMYKKQEGRCGICRSRLYSKRYKAFAVDHCHDTGRIRGLLCTNCNTGLGLFKDDPIALQRAIEWTKV